MKLLSIAFSELENTPQEWSAKSGLEFGDINLLVGPNATGKSRTLNIIFGLASLLSGRAKPFKTGSYVARFENGKKEIVTYELRFKDNAVIHEVFKIGSKVYLTRQKQKATIIARVPGKEINLKFEPPADEISAHIRRDALLHPFFNEVYEWASEMRHYRFNTPLGKGHLAAFAPNGQETDDYDFNQVTAIYRKGLKLFGSDFKNKVIKDMASLNYHIVDIELKTPISAVGVPETFVGLAVKERDLLGITDQLSMSDGMFRALWKR